MGQFFAQEEGENMLPFPLNEVKELGRGDNGEAESLSCGHPG